MRAEPQAHIELEIQLLRHIQFCQQVFNSDASWGYKHERIFGIHRRYIQPLLRRMRIRFEWVDLDAGYEDDDYEDEVKDYMWAVENNLLPDVEAVVESDFDTGD